MCQDPSSSNLSRLKHWYGRKAPSLSDKLGDHSWSHWSEQGRYPESSCHFTLLIMMVYSFTISLPQRWPGTTNFDLGSAMSSIPNVSRSIKLHFKSSWTTFFCQSDREIIKAAIIDGDCTWIAMVDLCYCVVVTWMKHPGNCPVHTRYSDEISLN